MPVLLPLGVSTKHVCLDLSLVGLICQTGYLDLLSTNLIIDTVLTVSIIFKLTLNLMNSSSDGLSLSPRGMSDLFF